MIARRDRTTGAAILLFVLGAFTLVNAVVAIVAAEWYHAIVLEEMGPALGPQTSEMLESSARLTARVTQLSWVASLVEVVFHWVAAAAVLTRGGSWGRIVGLVAAAVGLFGTSYEVLAYATVSQWAAPLPALAWLPRDAAVLVSVAASVLVVIGYVVTLILLARAPAGDLREGTATAR